MTSETVLNFRIERADPDGSPLPRVAVEMRGMAIKGAVAIGDWVELDAKWSPGQTLRPTKVTNLSSNSTISVGGKGLKVSRIVITVVLAFWGLFIAIQFLPLVLK